MDYSNKLTALPEVYHPWPTSRHLMGIEILSVFVPFRAEIEPTPQFVERLFPDLVQWNSDAPADAATKPK